MSDSKAAKNTDQTGPMPPEFRPVHWYAEMREWESRGGNAPEGMHCWAYIHSIDTEEAVCIQEKGHDGNAHEPLDQAEPESAIGQPFLDYLTRVYKGKDYALYATPDNKIGLKYKGQTALARPDIWIRLLQGAHNATLRLLCEDVDSLLNNLAGYRAFNVHTAATQEAIRRVAQRMREVQEIDL